MPPSALLPRIPSPPTARASAIVQLARKSAQTNPGPTSARKMHKRIAAAHVRTRAPSPTKNSRTNSQARHIRTRQHLVSAAFRANEPPRCTFEPDARPVPARFMPAATRRNEPKPRHPLPERTDKPGLARPRRPDRVSGARTNPAAVEREGGAGMRGPVRRTSGETNPRPPLRGWSRRARRRRAARDPLGRACPAPNMHGWRRRAG